MSVRRRTYRDRNGAEGSHWLVDVVFEHADGRVERVRKVSPVQTKRGAEAYERELRASRLGLAVLPAPFAPSAPEPKKEVPTVAVFAETRWLPNDAQATNRASTIAEKRSQLKLHILPQLGRLRLDAIGPEQISGFYAHLKGRGLSVKTCKNIGGTLHRLFACAVEWEVIDKMPKFPRLKVPDPKWDFYTREETEKLLGVVTDPFERAILVFAFHTGARSGEQIAITWGDIDWHNNFVVFRKASSRGVVGPTKDGDERRVPMTPQLVDALRKIRHLRSDLVFCQENGKPLNIWHLSRAMNRACRLAGLRRIRRHDARHSFASQLVAANVPLLQVQAWLGHSTIEMTMKYAHLAPSDGSRLIRALDFASNPALPTKLRHTDGTTERVGT